jgi:hypothetical protein
MIDFVLQCICIFRYRPLGFESDQCADTAAQTIGHPRKQHKGVCTDLIQGFSDLDVAEKPEKYLFECNKYPGQHNKASVM